jgi:hypothetical protein
MSQTLKVDSDAFSAGQIESKIWAAEELEKIVTELGTGPLRVYILGGWYSLLHFILKVRKNIDLAYCRSVDLDPLTCYTANKINNTWEYDNWKFRSYPFDANKLDYVYSNENINCVINTSTEHFDSNLWYTLIPNGTLVLLQSNNLEIPDHVRISKSRYDLSKLYPMQKQLFLGTKKFDFDKIKYDRHMLIGIK